MKKTVKVAIIGIVIYIIGSILTDDPRNLKNTVGITMMFTSIFLFGGIITLELIRRKKIIIED